MKRFAFLFILTTLLLGSCAPATASPTQPVAATVTQTTPPFPTLTPTLTAIPSATPYPPLHTQGPYLLYTRDHKSLTIMDADGSGRKQIQLPEDGYIRHPLEKAVSPDGKWLAYFTGSEEKPYDLALNLFNLEDETSFLIARLIASGFPQNLEPLTRLLKFTDYDKDCALSIECKLNAVRLSFIDGIGTIKWHPNGKELVFAAQIEGYSSDIYIYNVESKTLYRLTKEEENIHQINLSPDGKRILYTTSLRGGGLYANINIRVAASESITVQNPPVDYSGIFLGDDRWVSNDKFIFSLFGDGGPQGHHVQYLDISIHKKKIVWLYSTEDLLIDPRNQKLILSTIPFGVDEWQPEPEQGTYIVNLDGTHSKISDDVYRFFDKQDFANSYFGMDINHQIVNIDFDGTVIKLPRKGYLVSSPRTSPDGKYVLIIDDMGIELYSERLELMKSWDTNSDTIVWRPDSKGAILYGLHKNMIGELYYLPIPNGEPRLVDTCSPSELNCYPFEYVWLP